jgi:hypothetical protein
MIWIVLIVGFVLLGIYGNWAEERDRKFAIKNGQKPMPKYDHLGGLFALRNRHIKDPYKMEKLIKDEEERRATEEERIRQDKIIAEIKREEELSQYKKKYPDRFEEKA